MRFAKKFTAITIVLAMVFSLVSFSTFAAADVVVTSDFSATTIVEGTPVTMNLYVTPGSYGFGTGVVVSFDKDVFTVADASAATAGLKPGAAALTNANGDGTLELGTMSGFTATEDAVATITFTLKGGASAGNYIIAVENLVFMSSDLMTQYEAESQADAVITVPEAVTVSEDYAAEPVTIEYGATATLPTTVTLNGVNEEGEARTAEATVVWDAVDNKTIGDQTINGTLTAVSDLTTIEDGVKATCQVTVTKANATGIEFAFVVEVGVDETAPAGSQAAIDAINAALPSTVKLIYANGQEDADVTWDPSDIAGISLAELAEDAGTVTGTVADTDHVLKGLYGTANVTIKVVDNSEDVTFEVKNVNVGKKYQIDVKRSLTEDAEPGTVMPEKAVQVVVNNGIEDIATLNGSFAEGQAKITLRGEANIADTEQGKTYTFTVKYGSKTLEPATAVVGKKASSTSDIIVPSGSGSSEPSATPAPSEEPGDEPTDEPTDVPTVEPIAGFYDLGDVEWAQEAIAALVDAGVITGDGSGNFYPNNLITRAEFTKMIVSALGLTPGGSVEFKDCGEDKWYTPYVAAAVEAGIVNGESAEWFGAESNITRQDICTIIGRALGAETPDTELTFSDAADIADYAVDYVKLLVDLKIVNGYEDGTFGPKNNATRAEAAKIIYGIVKIVAPVAVVEEAPAE